MKKTLLILMLLFLHCCTEKKEITLTNTTTDTIDDSITKSDEKKVDLYKGCGFNSLQEIEANFLPPEDRVVQIINNIVSYSGLPNNFRIYRADYINNAFATIIDNERVIIYDSKLFNDVEWYSDTFWTSVSILAHEIGHHLSGHTMDEFGSVPTKELEADKFSGHVLYKMGASKTQSIKAITLLASEYDTSTHPSKTRRVKSIIEGWDQSNNQRSNSALPPAPNDNQDSFHIYDQFMLINNEIIDSRPEWFSGIDYLYGVVMDYNIDNQKINIRVLKTSKEFSNNFRNITNENWDVYIESPRFGDNTTMCRNCAATLKYLLSQGRRIKFRMVESLPDHGTSLNGVWFLTYLEVLPSNYFNK